MNRKKYIFLFLSVLLLAGCSTTRSLRDGEFMLRKNFVKVNDSKFNASALTSYITQKPNSTILGFNPLLSVYNWGGTKDTKMAQFFRNVGIAPVVYDASQVDASIDNIKNYLQYIGYYGSEVESLVEVHGRKVDVNYYVSLGKRYKISEIDYEVPDYGTFAQDFADDQKNSTIKTGQYLSAANLETEADRSAQYFRTKGYFGFTKSYYAFEADTLAGDGNAKLKMFIRDYAMGDAPEAAKEHKKFYIGDVTIAYPERVKIRPSVLESRNTIAPGQLYDERNINTAYSRLSNLTMLSGVNIAMNPVSDNRVDAAITLQNSDLQGFKNNLEASVNSTGLIGVSPQINYYHRNLFHGGELLQLGLKGNFQFKPNDKDTYSTEFTVTTSLRFPQFLGLPSRLFKGPNMPHTIFNASFSYQDRPEYRRTLISTSLAYSGKIGNNFYYQFAPFQANVARLFDYNDDFILNLLTKNPFLFFAYMDHFDLGVGGTLYYTTDNSAVPLKSYHYYQFDFDISGNLLSLFNRWMPENEYHHHTIWETEYSQYIKGEVKIGRTIRFGKQDKQAFAYRFLAGAGYAYGNSSNIPFEKQFYVGGANSMRGWQARALGPGNAITYSDLFAIPSQVGEMKLEANVEYRFPLIWKLEGALFVDAGNVWDMPTHDVMLEGEYLGEFHFRNLPESTALDWGLGIRVNLDFLLVRLDAGFRVHDPGRSAGDRWVGPDLWFKGNYAIHFGVGYPF